MVDFRLLRPPTGAQERSNRMEPAQALEKMKEDQNVHWEDR